MNVKDKKQRALVLLAIFGSIFLIFLIATNWLAYTYGYPPKILEHCFGLFPWFFIWQQWDISNFYIWLQRFGAIMLPISFGAVVFFHLDERESNKKKIKLITLGLVFGVFLLISGMISQLTGNHLNIEPNYYFFYDPLQIFTWAKYYSYGPARLVLGISIVASILTVALIVKTFLSRTNADQETLHGSARWATKRETKKGELHSESGICIGKIGNQELKYSGDSHVFLAAPTRTGKGVGVVLPTLLNWQSSCVVMDIKDECYQLTSGWRKSIGQNIYRFAPGEKENMSRWNPILEIENDDNAIGMAQLIAQVLVDPSGAQSDQRDHWSKSAYSLLTGAILHVRFREAEPNLATVGKLLSGSLEEADKDSFFWNRMLSFCPGQKKAEQGAIDGVRPVWEHAVFQTAKEMEKKQEKERDGIISSATSLLDPWKNNLLAANTAVSDFKIDDLAFEEKAASLYIYCPTSSIERFRVILRMLVVLIASRYTEGLDYVDGRSVSRNKHKLLLMLDEFASLGRMSVIEMGLSYFAGYGLQVCIVCQDFGQLYKAYGREETITGNCAVRVMFTPVKVDTAEKISRILGNKTVKKSSSSNSSRGFNFFPDSSSSSLSSVSKPLMAPDELLAMSNDHEIISLDGMRPIYAQKIRYFKDPTYLKRAKMKPSEAFSKETEKKPPKKDSQDVQKVVESKESTKPDATQEEEEAAKEKTEKKLIEEEILENLERDLH